MNLASIRLDFWNATTLGGIYLFDAGKGAGVP